MWVLEQPAQETKGPAGRFPKDSQPVSLEGRALGGKCFYLLQDSRPTPAKNWHPNSPQILGGFPKGRAIDPLTCHQASDRQEEASSLSHQSGEGQRKLGVSNWSMWRRRCWNPEAAGQCGASQ